MPLAAKKNTRTEKVTPAELDVEPLAEGVQEPIPEPPRVTVLISSYNNAPALRRCLQALEASTIRPRMEIVVVDKGSRDESPTLDTDFPETTFLRLPRNFGNTKALNIGMRTGVGELVFFLAPEVEVAQDTVERLVQFLDEQTEAVAVCPRLTAQGGAPVEQAYRFPDRSSGAKLIPVALPAGSGDVAVEYATFDAMLARKYFIAGINYLDDRYGEFGADAELCFQIRRAGRKLIIASTIAVERDSRPEPPPGAKDLLAADRIHGLAVYFGKRDGFLSGLLFRIGQIFAALFGFRLGLLWQLLSGAKVDGSQSVL